MTSSSSGDARLEALAEEYLARRRAGEAVDVEDYCRDHPELAGEIRSLFETLDLMEGLRSDWSEDGEQSGPPEVPNEGRLSGYRLLREIGRGGMGVVYEAEQESLGRRVALKVLSKGKLPEPGSARRFAQEARAAAKLHHTNIVPVFEVGEDGDHLFYAMQLIKGASLERVIEELIARRRGAVEIEEERRSSDDAAAITRHFLEDRFEPEAFAASPSSGSTEIGAGPGEPAAEVLLDSLVIDDDITTSSRSFHRSVARIGLQVAQALAYSHSRGIIHRDIKPSNLILDPAGVVWVADFGLAKETGQENMTQTGSLVGTLRYMSPERFEGRCDERADLYALGLTLYELLVLKPAISARNRAEMIDSILHRNPPGPRTIDSRIPRDLETIVLHAISKEPERRYESAEAMAEDLRRFLQDEPILARRISLLGRAWRWSRRNRVLAASIACIVLLVTTATVASIIAAEHFRRQRGFAQDAQRLAERSETEMQKTLYLAEMNLASAAAEKGGGMNQVRALLDRWRPEVAGADRRGFEWYYLNGLYGREANTLRGHRDRVMTLAFAPSGDQLLSTGSDGTAWIWDVPNGDHPRSIAARPGWLMWGGWSPDGAKVATSGREASAAIWSAETLEPVRRWAIDGQVVDGDWVQGRIALVKGGQLEIYDSGSGELILREFFDEDTTGEVSLSPDGELVAVGGWSNRIRIWRIADQKLVPHMTLDGHQAHIEALSWHATGQWLASGDSDGVVQVWRREGWIPLRMSAVHDGLVDSLAWHEDLLASASHDHTVAVWDTRSGQRLHRFEGQTDRLDAVAWSPDGHWIASGCRDSTINLWRWPPAEDDLALIERTDGLQAVSWSPDGARLAVAGYRGIVSWHLDRESGPLREGLTDAYSLDARWSPDGSRLAATEIFEIVLRSATPERKELWRRVADSGVLLCLDWSPDGRRIVTGGASAVRVWEADSGELLETLSEGARTRGVGWSPSGRYVASASNDGKLRVHEIGESDRPAFEANGSVPVSVVWSPDGRHIASAWEDSMIRIHDLESGRLLGVLRGHRGVVRDLAWSPDGSRLASCSDDRSIRLWNPRTFEQTLSLQRHTAAVRSIDWSHDGRRLVSADENGRIQIWDATHGYEAEARTAPRVR